MTHRNTFRSVLRSAAKALIACALLGNASFASADDDNFSEIGAIEIGIYAPTPAAAAVWTCDSVLNTVSRKMSQRLDQVVEVSSYVHDDAAAGRDEVIQGTVALGRFPNVPSHWVAHPTTPQSTISAFVEVINELGYEEVVDRIDGDVAIDCDEVEDLAASFGRSV